ncbi:glycosyltransferase [Thermoactinospora rubra]|uniref:glycosyltransferase n=1 Tax=Thermoactinospora rubra TaxID=1088767 RepID=UPI001301FE3E|nr:glycosyltransferase family 2 protein [Thermoactinospora rubra]
MSVLIRHNDYGSLDPPALGTWEPELTVSVVIPARNCQEGLERTLASLAEQTYPRDLMEVVVVDDGSDPPLRAEGARVVRVANGWGRGAARQAGADAASGQVIHWLDSDMMLAEDHIEAHMRWHHLTPYVVVIGDVTFLTPEEVKPRYTADMLESTRRLRDAGGSAYLLHTGATTSVRAALLRAAGGVDASLNMAEDTELGYRLAQAGAVFVPDEEARAWHVGESTVMRRQQEVHRHNWSYLGDYIPDLRWLRGHPRRQWLVPYVMVVVEAGGYEETRASVDSALAGTVPDVAVTLVGPWSSLPGGRRECLDEPLLDLRLTRHLYTHEPRVRFAESPPASVAPTPYLLRLPTGWSLGADTLARLVRLAEADTLGLVSVALAETPEGVVTARLERTAAFARARFHDGRPDDVVDALFGSMWVSGEEYGFAAEPEPLAGDPAKWRAVAAERQKEIERLRAELERLSARTPDSPLKALFRQLRSVG